MSALSDYAENLLQTFLMTATAVTRPTAWHVGLHTADPSETGATGELSGNGYARQSATFTVTGSLSSNAALLTFGPCTTANWGNVTHISVWTAATAGSCLWKGALSSPATINVGDKLEIAAGALNLTLD